MPWFDHWHGSGGVCALNEELLLLSFSCRSEATRVLGTQVFHEYFVEPVHLTFLV